MENIKALQKREFVQFLLDLSNDTLNDQSNNVQISERCIANANSDIIKETYENIITHKQYKTIVNHVILSARNVDVDKINEKVINLLNETIERIYKCKYF